jgi:hypothetical protein
MAPGLAEGQPKVARAKYMDSIRIRNATQNRYTYGSEFVVSVLRDGEGRPNFVGSAFLLSNNGVFATAKHVLETNPGSNIFDTRLFGLVMIKGTPCRLEIAQACFHPAADVAVGVVSPTSNKADVIDEYLNIDVPGLYFESDPAHGDIQTYAFPKSTFEAIEETVVRMNYIPTRYWGKITTFLPRFPLINNEGYQCEVPIEPGCSGAPVLAAVSGKIIAINSASVLLGPNQAPIMYASDVRLIGNLFVTDVDLPGGKSHDKISITELRALSFIR